MSQSRIPSGARALITGQIHFAKSGPQVWTVLGSCVAIVLHSEPYGWSSICHAQLPTRKQKTRPHSEYCPDTCDRTACGDIDMKYVDCALKEMLRLFRKKSVPLASVSAAVFGGSTQHVGASDKESVGEKNLRVAKRILAFHRIPVYQESTGGVHGRTILLDCATGDVMVKMHGRSAGKH